MRIKTVNLINVVGMQRVIEAKDVHFDVNNYGVEVTPKGAPSFRNRPRFVPWANISSCDIFTDAEMDQMLEKERRAEEARANAGISPPADPITVVVPDPEPTRGPVVDDTIVFSKNEAGQTVETKRSAPVIPSKDAGGDPIKSAFAKAAAAKIPTQNPD